MTTSSDELVRAVRKDLADLPSGGHVIVACSGGPDSMALAAATRRCKVSAAAVIIDHGMQPESDRIAEQAAVACAELGFAGVEVVRVQPDGPGGPEAQARRARYAELRRQAQLQSAAAVLLGHTMDDQAETVLLGLTRGSGPRALAGMPRRNGVFRRPLLGIRRNVVRSAFPDVPVWEDPHNSDDRFRRSLVRHEVLPAIVAELGDSVVPALARSAELVRAESDAVDSWASHLIAEHVRGHPQVHVQCAPMVDVPQAVLARVMLAAAERAGCPRSGLTSVHVHALTDLIGRWRGQGGVDLPGGVVAERISGTVVLGQRRSTA